MSNVTISGFSQLTNKIRTLAELVQGKIDAPFREGAERVVKRLQDYPPQRQGPQPFRTDKSRRFFFAALKDGRIIVPYRRTEKLKNAWRIQRVGLLTFAATNDTSYGPLVHSAAQQTFYHRQTGWPIQEQVEQEEIKSVGEIFLRHIQKVISG